MPLSSSVGSKTASTPPASGSLPPAKRVQVESLVNRYSRRQLASVALSALPTTFTRSTTVAPSGGLVIATVGAGPTGAAGWTNTRTSSAAVSTESLAESLSTYRPGSVNVAVV